MSPLSPPPAWPAATCRHPPLRPPGRRLSPPSAPLARRPALPAAACRRPPLAATAHHRPSARHRSPSQEEGIERRRGDRERTSEEYEWRERG
uniref:Uncharacterized protein n=1 Tax=Oryza rufipogon TaxID=4529 RepID=A0A0E0R643_ORYRU